MNFMLSWWWRRRKSATAGMNSEERAMETLFLSYQTLHAAGSSEKLVAKV